MTCNLHASFRCARLLSTGIFAALFTFNAGCGGPEPPKIVPARGVVTLGGAPLPKASVRFMPLAGVDADYIATGVTDDQGRFELTCNGEPGACAVENTVLISEGEVPSELLSENKQRELTAYRRSLKNRPIPKNYATPVQTPLKASVVEGQQEYNFELTR
jgi:hypothetical protein